MNHQSSISVAPVKVFKGISELGVVIALTMFLPTVVHMFPSWDDSPIGAKLLPIFYAPLIAALTRRLHVSLIACLLSPWINYLLFGRPSLGVAAMLCIQLVPFAYLVYRLGQRFKRWYWIGPVAYLVSKPIILLLFYTIPNMMPPVDPIGYTIQTTSNAIPGVFILGLLGHFSNRFFPPSANA